jgi:monoamine oxidase
MTLTRRGFLTGAASLALMRRSQASADVDVAIVGAGAAGLAAAKALRRAGRSFVVLEARPRVGGRAFTDRSLGVPFDAGAQYIHWAERNPWKVIAEELRAELSEDRGGGIPHVFRNGAPLPEDERARRRGAFGRLWRAISDDQGVDRSLLEAVGSASPEVLDAAAGLTLFSLGEDPQRVSFLDYQQLWSGDDYLLPQGYGTLVERYGADVPVRLAAPVSRIRWDGGGVELETPHGVVRAKAAVVTLPIGVLQAESVRFAPVLPLDALRAIDGLRMGALTKLALKINRARLGPLDATDLIELGDGGAVTSYEFWPFEQDFALVTLGGDHARRLCEAGEGAAVDFAVERLAAMVGSRVRQAVTGGRLAGWWTDPFARGSYSIARPRSGAAREALRAPVGERIWFAGEATAGGGAMTVGGATLDGERAAAAVSEQLGQRHARARDLGSGGADDAGCAVPAKP